MQQRRGRLSRLAMVLSAAALVLAGTPALAGAATVAVPGWLLTPAPPRAAVPNDGLSGMSCAGSGMCMAVGSTSPINASQRPLAEVWNGTAWQAQQAATPQRGGVFNAVSCNSPTSCVATGYSYNRVGSQIPLAEGWNGTSWTIQSVPAPARSSQITLAAISCTAAGACTAVGSYVNHGGTQVPLAESWNGTTWTVQSVPAPSGVQASSLAGVSCTSASACVAVGNSGTSSGTESVLTELWNGTAWVIASAPSPGSQSGLAGVACPAAADCMAVGFSPSGTLVEHWNGTSWVVQASPNPSGSPALTAVACTSASACTVVGTSNGTNGSVTLAEAWNGTSWTIQPTPTPAGFGLLAEPQVAAVGCTSASHCTAVGSYFASSAAPVILGVTWNGTSWALSSLPEIKYAENTTLTAVTCASATACTAVGSVSTTNFLVEPVAEQWNGTRWRVRELPGEGNLTSISCTTPAACTAVGTSSDGQSGTGGFAERWNGTTWRQQAPVLPPGSFSFSLSAVACPALNECIAVGGSTAGTLAEIWNGTSWAVQPVPSGGDSPTAIACTDSSDSTAVGFASAFASLALRWNGSAWSQQSIPNDGPLAAVACPALSECLAAGSTTGSPVNASAEEWNGTSWGTQTIPSPSSGGALSALACPAANTCMAAGGAGSAGTQGTLAEAWNGTSWSIQTTPNPAGAAGSLFGGIACPAASTCMAVGYSTAATGKQTPLAATYSG